MNQEFEKTKTFLEQHNNFLLATHAHTDGDDCGSMLALVDYLKNIGKTATPVAVGGVPPILKFLPGQHEVLKDLPLDADKKFDAVILFGCSNKGRTELAGLETLKLPVLNIDHHPDNGMYGDVNLVDREKSSVAELIYDLFKYLGAELNAGIAKCLLTGILTDTGSFMHSNTSAATLNAAGELMKYGARVDKIFNFTYSNKDLPSIQAWAKALENTKIDPNNKIAICVLSEEDMQSIGPISEDAFDGFVDTLNTIPDTRFSIFVRQDGDYIRGSIRSEEYKKIDVAKIAKAIAGGGGHKLAAGFKVKGRLQKQPDGSWKIL